MGNQHSNQLNLKHLNRKIKKKTKLSSNLIPSSLKNSVDDRGTAFLCHSNGCMISKVQFKCNFCSTIKTSAWAIKQHYVNRHHFFESTEKLNESTNNQNSFSNSFVEESLKDEKKENCTLFIQDKDLIVRCSTLNYEVLNFDNKNLDDEIGYNNNIIQNDSDLRIKRINELNKLRQELTKLNAFSKMVDSVENEFKPVCNQSIRLRKFDGDFLINKQNCNEDQLNNNLFFKNQNNDGKLKKQIMPNTTSEGEQISSNSSSSSSFICQSDTEQNQIENHLFTLNNLSKDVEHLSETSSIDTTFAGSLDARCTVCNAYNYVVCIQRRLGRQVCANCFRFFRHFLSDPVVYACEQLGKCDLNKPIKPLIYHPNHNSNNRTSKIPKQGTASKYIVKQQQLGIINSKSNTLQNFSKNKNTKHLNQKELSFCSMNSTFNNSFNNNNLAKSMTLNSAKNCFYKENRNASPNLSNLSWTASSSPTYSNKSFTNGVKNSISVNNQKNSLTDKNNSTKTISNVRCNACWIKKCIETYIEIQFDESIMKTLNDFSPIQLSSVDEISKNKIINYESQKNQTLNKQKRFYSNRKAKSVSKLFHYSEKNDLSNNNTLTKNKTADDENQLLDLKTDKIKNQSDKLQTKFLNNKENQKFKNFSTLPNTKLNKKSEKEIENIKKTKNLNEIEISSEIKNNEDLKILNKLENSSEIENLEKLEILSQKENKAHNLNKNQLEKYSGNEIPKETESLNELENLKKKIDLDKPKIIGEVENFVEMENFDLNKKNTIEKNSVSIEKNLKANDSIALNYQKTNKIMELNENSLVELNNQLTFKPTNIVDQKNKTLSPNVNNSSKIINDKNEQVTNEIISVNGNSNEKKSNYFLNDNSLNYKEKIKKNFTNVKNQVTPDNSLMEKIKSKNLIYTQKPFDLDSLSNNLSSFKNFQGFSEKI